MFVGIGRINLVLAVEGGRGGSELERGAVLFVMIHQLLNELRGTTRAEHQYARRLRIQRPSMAYLDALDARHLTHHDAHLIDHVKGGPPQRLVQWYDRSRT